MGLNTAVLFWAALITEQWTGYFQRHFNYPAVFSGMQKEGRQVFQVAPEPQSQVRSGPAGCHLQLRGSRAMPSEQKCSRSGSRRLALLYFPPQCLVLRPSWRRGRRRELRSDLRPAAPGWSDGPPRSPEPAGEAGAQLPVRAVAPGPCPGVLGAAAAPRHPSTDTAL